MVHHYTLEREEAREFAGMIAGASRRALERLPAVPRRRIDDLPYRRDGPAAAAAERPAPGRVVFSANGMREGWFMRRMPEDVRRSTRCSPPGGSYARWLAAIQPCRPRCWTGPIRCFPPRPARRDGCARPRAGCRISAATTTGVSRRAGFLRVFRQPGIGLDHHARAFLALAIGIRYEAGPDAPFLQPPARCWTSRARHRAETLGLRCASPTPCPPARPTCWPARRCASRAAGWC